MNPSSPGWIAKFGHIVKENEKNKLIFKDIYDQLKSNGFIYGYNRRLDIKQFNQLEYSRDEIAKINLFAGLYSIYNLFSPVKKYDDFISQLYIFYNALQVYPPNLFARFIRGQDKKRTLEGFINDRVLINRNYITRQFSNTITNALLYIDILTFKAFLKNRIDVIPYVQNLELAILQISMDASYQADSDENISREKIYDMLFKGSYYYSKTDGIKDKTPDSSFNFLDYKKYERLYLLDIAALHCYSDLEFSERDTIYLNGLCIKLNLSPSHVDRTISSVKSFFINNQQERRSIKHSTPILNFYDNSTQLVSKLIKRNFKRIVQEIAESKELVILISQARKRNLTKEEQKQIQDQLLDIFKTIPSLAIFLLPGGMLIFPLVVKILPNMLPSSFDDNKV